MERHDRTLRPSAPALELRIEEVVLHGFGAGDRYRIGEAIERELSRLLAEGALPSRLDGDVHAGELDGGGFDLPRGARGEEIGALIARAVFDGLRSAMTPTADADGPVRGAASNSVGGWGAREADGAGEAASDGGRL